MSLVSPFYICAVAWLISYDMKWGVKISKYRFITCPSRVYHTRFVAKLRHHEKQFSSIFHFIGPNEIFYENLVHFLI